MQLAEMSIDEAIADCVRQVPETKPDASWGPWPDDCETWHGQDKGTRIYIPEAIRALWFHAAWVWLLRQDSALMIEYAGGDKWAVRWENENRWAIPEPFPTEYHALAAAVLLSHGKPLP